MNLSLFDEYQQEAEEHPGERRESDVLAGVDRPSDRNVHHSGSSRREEESPAGVGCTLFGQAEHRGEEATFEDVGGMSEVRASRIDPGSVDHVRMEAAGRLNPVRKIELGQFMTPGNIARFMASLFSERKGAVRLLDAGAGVGSLTAAFISRWANDGMAVTAYEIDPVLAAYLRETLARYGDRISSTIIERDFIQDAVFRLKLGKRSQGFTHAILNPPYKKISSVSEHRTLLRVAGLETVNLYTGFLGLALELMGAGGEIVAIIPRSFCNGLYYKPFREWMLARSSVEHIHLFHSRTSAFHDDEVLQENVIIKLKRGKKQGTVTITTSSDTSFSDLASYQYPFAEIVHSNDEQKFIHVPTAPSHTGIGGVPLAKTSLAELGLQVSTGPVVDFRLKGFLRENPESGAAPLLYPTHFSSGSLVWPLRSKKPNAILNNAETRKWLYPNGCYTVVRRFSSKEERRRVVAHVVDAGVFDAALIGFENHLNVFHSGKKGLDQNVARGLSVFLNSTAVDDYFRRFSGHTQVNATDLRLLRYPELEELQRLGQWSLAQGQLTQDLIDARVGAADGRRE
ncbi:MAG: Eco57I restriction-modification methylase domain-containing protein [Bryobacterales bacterium]|nr:Eco57I restriction-modification methylase domain-containing protein [Bryobacterales bacterium]